VHRVIAARDTASSVNAAHLPATCGQEDCHPGARLPFAMSGANHLALRVRREPGLAAFEGLLIGGGVALLVLLGGVAALDAQRRFIGRPRPAPAGRGGLVPRLGTTMRLQHGALVVAFVLLALTGLPLRFPDSAAARWLYDLLGGAGPARVAHRAGGVLLALTGIAHLAWALVLLRRARGDVRLAWPMLPDRTDASEAWHAVLHAVRIRAAAPEHGRHHFREKVHYLAVCWGVPMMVASGLVLWFPVFFGNRLPDPWLVLAHLAHGDEALIAIGVVVLWHFYTVHVMPWPHHRFMTWLDGRVHHAHWVAEHGREAAAAADAARRAPGAGGGT
jgi:cytochrome b subunit of formate dehydrogenase